MRAGTAVTGSTQTRTNPFFGPPFICQPAALACKLPRMPASHTRSILLPFLLVAVIASAAPQAKPPRVVLVNNGAPACTIVVPSPASAIDRRAAEILQSSVRKMTGAVLPIAEMRGPRPLTGETPVPLDRPINGVSRGTGVPPVGTSIRIGFPREALPTSLASAAKGLRDDGFLVATSGRDLYIVSGGHKGAIYGVVHLLEKHFGCRTFSPTVEVFPGRDTLRLGAVLETDNPVNEFRVINGEFGRDPDHQDWLRLDLTDEMFGKRYYVHTFNRLVPWETYFEAHPESFALMNGKRIKDQLCLTRPEVLTMALARLRAEMAAQPDKPVWSVSQNDNFSYCQCDECRKIIDEEGSPAGPSAGRTAYPPCNGGSDSMSATAHFAAPLRRAAHECLGSSRPVCRLSMLPALGPRGEADRYRHERQSAHRR
jgi:hypothetical protein